MVSKDRVAAAEQILVNNGIEADEASIVLQAIGFALLDKDLYQPKYRARCIQWASQNDGSKHVEVDLPVEVTVELKDLGLPDNATDAEISNALSDYLSDTYGRCHAGFFFEKVY